MRKFSVFGFLALTLTVSLAHAGQGTRTQAMQIEVRQKVEVLKSPSRTLSLKKENGEIIRFECGQNMDEFYNNTFLDWPNFRAAVQGRIFTGLQLKSEIGALARFDFYCDTFSGKGDEVQYQVSKNLAAAVGKTLELVARIIVTVVDTEKQLVETVSVSELRFQDAETGEVIAIYSARPMDRIVGGSYPLTSSAVVEKTP